MVDAIFFLVNRKQWQCRIKANDGMQLSILNPLTSYAGNVRSQTVPNDVHILHHQPGMLLKLVEKTGKCLTNHGNTSDRSYCNPTLNLPQGDGRSFIEKDCGNSID
uniref:Uncharacterized protein n=1 Tax=Anopheles melas TaxID=34690 RepID=A0A182TIP1_9DIPT